YQNQCKWILHASPVLNGTGVLRLDCLYCGQQGQLIRNCPVRPPRPVVSTITSDIEPAQLILLPVVLHTAERSLSVSALVDSGSSANFISQEWFQVESPEPKIIPEIPAEYMAFQDVFSKQAATHLPPHRPWDCAIELLPGAQLTKGKVYPLSIPERQSMEEYIVEALEQGFIQPSTSPAASSFFFVGKKDGGLRPCIDYRQLNSQIVQQPYPLPLVPAALEELRGAQVFTKLDLRSAYNLVRLHAGDEWKTAFITPTGHYKYWVMLYGLSISPSVFQTFMNEVFREFLHRFVVVYIDNIFIYSRNQAEHRQHVQQVLQKLCDHSLYLKLEKCEFHQPSVQFLGYNISAEGVQMDQGKVNTILNWPPPNSIKELQCFLGFANFYRRFVKDYSSITAPLTSPLRGKPKHLTWNPAAHEAFQRPKNPSLVPLLCYITRTPSVPSLWRWMLPPPESKQYYHKRPVSHPSSIPVLFFSRKLSPAEQNYDVGNRELLAIKLALEEWRYWLEGANHPFIIITDHKNLQYLHEARRLNPRQARWALFLTRFNFTITYRQRISQQMLFHVCSLQNPIVWDLDWEIQQATLQELAPPECPEGKIYLTTLHALDTQAAVGPSRFYNLVTGGPVCTVTPSGKLVPLPIPQRPWSHLGIDFITDLPSSEARETAEQLFHQVLRHFGLPEEIVSDRGPQFISHVWKAFFKLLGISVNLSSGYHPQTNGQTERKIQELGRYLRAYCQDNQHSWSRFLPWAEYAQYSLRQDSTGLTPFQCVLGYQPPLFPWMEEPSNVPAVDHWFRESERVWDSAHHHLQLAVRRHKIFADARRRAAPIYQPEDLVWLSTCDLRLRLPCCKLSPRYTDPPGAEAEPPPPEVLDQPLIFTVHEILDSRRRGGHLEYLVDWEGYGPEERSWVHRDDILDPLLMLEFHRSHPDRPAPRSRGRPRRRVRASGAAPGGGGNVRRSPQPPPSAMLPTAPPTLSASP
ncbi:hypothetical protein M9458_028925, partial [Cirrhinus mrigala]